MEYTNKNNIYLLLKTIIYTIGFLSLIGISQLWTGSKEDWDQIRENEFIPALITRTVVFTTAGLVFLGLSFRINYIFKKESRFSKELVILLLFSFTLNLIVLSDFL
jgi:hypothetical protein